MSATGHTPGPWKANIGISATDDMRCGVTAVRGKTEYLLATIENGAPGDVCATEEANARLIAAAPEMLEALRLHQAWADSERAGPNYGGQTRDTHPDGERIWRQWWEGNLSLCDRANAATASAIAKATGGSNAD